MFINAHGYELGREEEYYTEFYNSIKSNGKTFGLDSDWQNKSTDTAYFGWMCYRIMRALQFIKSLPEGKFCIGTYCVAPYAQSEDHIRDMKECGIDFVIGLRGDKARPLRFVGQVNSYRKGFRISENMLRFQGFATMAFGGESIAWACWTKGWWTNQVIDMNGERTQQYDKLKKVNHELRTVAAEYMRFRNVSTHFVGFPADCPDLQRVDDRPMAALDDAQGNCCFPLASSSGVLVVVSHDEVGTECGH